MKYPLNDWWFHSTVSSNEGEETDLHHEFRDHPKEGRLVVKLPRCRVIQISCGELMRYVWGVQAESSRPPCVLLLKRRTKVRATD